MQGPTGISGTQFILKAHPDNTGNVYVGNDGNDDVDANSGVVLEPGDLLIPLHLGGYANALSALWFDAATDGDKICWLKVG